MRVSEGGGGAGQPRAMYCAECGCLVQPGGVRIAVCRLAGCCCSELPVREAKQEPAS
jgi:hypothetical protein